MRRGLTFSRLSRIQPAAPLGVPPEVVIDKGTQTHLRRWNVAMATFHAALMTVTLALGNVTLSVPLYRVRVLLSYYNETSGEHGPDVPEGQDTVWKVTPELYESGSLYPTLLAALFFALSAGFHALSAMPYVFDIYITQLSECKTPLRWIEYSLSAPVMFMLIAYGVGVRSLDTILCTAFLICITMPFGYWTELNARPRVDYKEWIDGKWIRLYPWCIGNVPQLVAWGVIIGRLYASDFDLSKVPWFVHLIVLLEVFLFFSFGFVALAVQLRPPNEFYRGEYAFQVLSLVSKGSLGLILLTNVLMLSRFDEIYE